MGDPAQAALITGLCSLTGIGLTSLLGWLRERGKRRAVEAATRRRAARLERQVRALRRDVLALKTEARRTAAAPVEEEAWAIRRSGSRQARPRRKR